MVDHRGRAVQQRENLGLELQRRLGHRRAHLVWLAAVAAATTVVGVFHWFGLGSLLAVAAGHPEMRPTFVLGLTAPTPFVLGAVLVPDTERWARALRRADQTLYKLRPRIDDCLALLGAYAVCLLLSSVVLGSRATPPSTLGLASAAMAAVVAGWRWSAASRESTMRAFTAMQIVVLVVAGLWVVNLAAEGRL